VLDYEALREQARGLILDYGGTVSAADVRVLLCDARITPVVLGGQGEPLDVGRSRRCATPAQRKAVAARDRGCAHPGCDRPPSWCQVHHIVSWQHHGETHVHNLVMLCRTHHRMVHRSGWKVRMHEGQPEFLPPKWLDATQTPRRKPNPRLLATTSASH
jgi:hypothetical protein